MFRLASHVSRNIHSNDSNKIYRKIYNIIIIRRYTICTIITKYNDIVFIHGFGRENMRPVFRQSKLTSWSLNTLFLSIFFYDGANFFRRYLLNKLFSSPPLPAPRIIWSAPYLLNMRNAICCHSVFPNFPLACVLFTTGLPIPIWAVKQFW